MAHWLLQHNPAKAGVCGLLRPGHNRGGWSIRRYRDRMAVGDDVAVWVSGSRGGVVALGCVVGEPRTGPDGVTVEVDLPRLFLDEAIRRDDLRADERFADALVLRMPGGSNPFPLTPPQWQAILDRAPAAPEPAASPPAPRPAPPETAASPPRPRPAPRPAAPETAASPPAPELAAPEPAASQPAPRPAAPAPRSAAPETAASPPAPEAAGRPLGGRHRLVARTVLTAAALAAAGATAIREAVRSVAR
jgi:hypothetical protein